MFLTVPLAYQFDKMAAREADSPSGKITKSQ
jgi:hypothetical protein